MQKINNISILKYGLTAVLISFVISMFVYMQFRLDEAVFLKHYYDMEINSNTNMDIHVITNSIDTRRIDEIIFPQMPDGFAYVMIGNINFQFNNRYYRTEKFAHYSYNIISLELNPINLNTNEDGEETVVLDKAVIRYDNNDIQEVDIGKIVLRKNVRRTESLQSTLVSSSNDNTSTSVFISNDNFVINSIASYLDEEVKGILKLSLNGTDTDEIDYPIHVTSDDSLTFDSQFRFDMKDARRYNVYDVQKRISLTDSEGNQESMRILNLNYRPTEAFLNEKDIIAYLSETGVR